MNNRTVALSEFLPIEGSEQPALVPTLIAPTILRSVVGIAAGGFHSAAVDAMGQVYTWGGYNLGKH
jgi:alpha-tubulin suppressor-like RCC1 family protein